MTPRFRRAPSFVLLAAAASFAGGVLAAHPAGAEQAPDAMTLTLGQVVMMAKERAPSVHAAFAQIASAEAGVSRSRAAVLPSLNLQGAGTAFTSNGQVIAGGVSSTSSAETYYLGSGSINLQWMLYDFGRTSKAIDAAKTGVKAATLSARATEEVAMAEAAVAFFTLLADDELVRTDETVRADRERVLTVTHTLVEGGYRTPVDETRAKIELDVA